MEWDRLNENLTTKIWNSQNDGFFHNNRDRPSDEHGRDDFRIYTSKTFEYMFYFFNEREIFYQSQISFFSLEASISLNRV